MLSVLLQIAEIIATVSKGDSALKKALAHVALLHDILEVLPKVQPVTAAKLLSSLKQLSMDQCSSEPLQLAGTIPKLVAMVAKTGPKPKHRTPAHLNATISNEVVSTLYSLCIDSKVIHNSNYCAILLE